MRLIPGRTKVKIELFRGITLSDVMVALVGLVLVTLCAVSSLPGRWGFAVVVLTIFVFLLFRLEEDPMYVFLWHMLRYRAYPRRFYRIYNDELLAKMAAGETVDALYEGPKKEAPSEGEVIDPSEAKRNLKEIIKEENRILKSKTATEEEKNAVWQARAERSAEKKKQKAATREEDASFEDMSTLVPFTGIRDGFIEYGGKYYGAVIEVDPVEFRFFSKIRRNNAIESCFGSVLRSLSGEYGANIVKLQRPIMYESYLDAEYDKLDALKKSYESGLLSEDELQARVEIQYDRINDVMALCNEDKVIESFYYVVLYESDMGRLGMTVNQAINSLEEGELTVRRLDDRGLALFLKYSNYLDFEESDIDKIDPEKWVDWAMPESVKFTMNKAIVNNIMTHNLRVVSFPSTVGDSWLAGVMSYPGTKVVVKATPIDKGKAIRHIDRSLSELRAKYIGTSTDSKMIEIQEHVETLSELLVMLQQNNESLLAVNIYITAYDPNLTIREGLVSEDFTSFLPRIPDMKKSIKRSWGEASMRLSGMDFMQIQSFIGSQISAYDPMLKEARDMPSNTISAMFPWIFAHISDRGGIKLGYSEGVPVFINFFRRDSERVNSNMVIVGKSGSGKSYATKSLLSNLASEDAKIFILDPENEYSALAHNLHGKIINVGNAKYGRLNPFHIITALDDDEAGEEGGGPGGSFATHLQFLEEFFRQILPDIDKDALEYLNSLVERVYLNYGITPNTDLSNFKADDYPIFDDLYDVILGEFERTNNEYLRQLLRSLVNYISKFSTGGRNANIWNGPSTITTDENFTVFNFQSMLANRNTLIANAQMLLVLKYIDNEIIKNRDYNLKYGLNRKIVVVIDEAHVFIDTKFPVALDFMFQLAKRIRKYNGMQIVITQNIKDFVGSEEISRKSSAIINACQYSFVFGLAPNDMADLCKLYEKAGGINEREQDDIVSAKRGQAFTIMSPTSRSSFTIDVPGSIVEMFEDQDFISNYFVGEEGNRVWEDFVADSREVHAMNYDRRKLEESEPRQKSDSSFGGLTFSEITEESGSTLSFSEVTEEEYEAETAAAEKAEYSADSKYDTEVGREDYAEYDDETETEYEEDETDSIDYDVDVEDEEEEEEESYYDRTTEFGDEDEDDDIEISYAEPQTLADRMAAKGFMQGKELRNEAKQGTKKSALERYMEASEYVDRKEYEMATGSAISAPQPVTSSDEPNVSQEYLDKALNKFKDSLRQEMEKELEDKIKWISLGAGLGRTASAGEPGYTRQEAFTPETSYSSNEYETLDEAEEEETLSLDAGIRRSVPEEEDDVDLLKGFNPDDLDEDFDEDDFDEDEDYDEDFADLSLKLDESDEDEFDEDEFEDEDEDSDIDDFEDDDEDEDDMDSLFAEESEEYEPAPFLFAELLAEAAEDYADMDIEDRMKEMGESVIEVTLEELSAYIKKSRKKK